MITLAQTALTTTLLLPNHSQSAHKEVPYGKRAVFVLVLLAHAGVFFAVLQTPIKATPIEMAEPITVSLLAAAPILDATPVKPKEQTKKVTPAKPKVKVVPKLIKPIETPAELKPQETEAEPVETPQPVSDPVINEETAPNIAKDPSPVEASIEAEEEQYDPPKFGVAYLNNPTPKYPTLSKRAGEQGRTVLRVLVSMAGDAESVGIATSSGFDRLDNAAVDAVRRWRFVPARKGGQALSAYVLVPIKFSLDR